MLSNLRAILNDSTSCAATIVFFGGAVLVTTIGLEVIAGVYPCALCLSQRLFLFLGSLAVLIALLHGGFPRTYTIFSGVFLLFGIALALRQIWIVLVPGARSSCGPGIDYLLNNDYPASIVVQAMLTGSADCADVAPVLPILSLAAFLLLVGLLVQQFRASRRIAT